ncbi:MAG: hypothetical protein AB203_00745 [Parcubacteria bacterium C7867-008]|nr:MAG: hypothetical protein AB203_00745 [Parcubacteria bacterium C7867-008]
MRITSLVLFTSLVLAASASAAHAEGDGMSMGSLGSFNGGITLQSGRPFPQQGINLTDRTTSEVSGTVCYGSLCGGVWHAETGKKSLNETDYTLNYGVDAGKAHVDFQVAGYAVAGKNIPEGKVTVSYPISGSCSSFASYEKLGGGFKETVLEAGGTCSIKLSERVSLGVTPAIAHSAALKAVTVNFNGDLSYQLNDHASVFAFTKAYRTLTSIQDGGHVMIGVGGRINY